MLPRRPGGLPYRRTLQQPDTGDAPPIIQTPRAPLVFAALRSGQIGSADVIPNLLMTTLAVVAAVGIPPGLQSFASAPQAKYQVQCDQYVNILVLGYNPQPRAGQLSDSAPPPKYAVQVDILRSAVVLLQPQVQRLEAYPQQKYQVQCDQYVNTLVLGYNPQPAIVQLSESAPRIKPPVYIDQPVHRPLTLGLNPQPKVQGLTESAPRARYQPQVEAYPNLLPLQPSAALPIGARLDASAPAAKYQIGIDQAVNRLPLASSANVTVGLIGQLITSGEGSLALTHAQALAGRLISPAAGTVGLAHTQGLLGRSATATEGSLATSRVLGLTGDLATFGQGVIVRASPDLTLALTGLRSTSGQGLLALSGDAVPVVTATQDAGKAGRPKRVLYLIKVDGRELATSSLAEALEVLAEVKRLAKIHAQQISRQATELALQSPRPQPLRPALPKITGSRPLTAAVRETRKEIEDIYRAAFRDSEIRMWLEVSRRADEDEDISLLLM